MKNPGNVEIDASPKSGDKVTAGGLTGEIMLTPGHTQGSLCVYFEADKKLVAGDTLFAGSIGRTDLPGGSYEKILRSLHTKVMALPDDVIVVPGHGPVTTIGTEREENPFLQK
jgi:glyoxylase-like metal-dependent hydrolase (beta-lactamase superfamily II)